HARAHVVTGVGVEAAVGRSGVEAGGLDGVDHVRRHGQAVGGAGLVVDDQGLAGGVGGDVLHAGGAQLSDHGGGKSLGAGGGQEAGLAEVVAGEAAVHVGQGRIVLQ